MVLLIIQLIQKSKKYYLIVDFIGYKVAYMLQKNKIYI